MGSRIECFLIVPTSRTDRKLRRYHSTAYGVTPTPEEVCPGKYGYHNGHSPYPGGTCSLDIDKGCWVFGDDHGPAHDDPRWPTKCDDCGYLFRDGDNWQLFTDVIYARADNPAVEMTLRTCPPGAIWDCSSWYPGKGADGLSFCVSLPPDGGMDYWHIDGISQSGGKWTRTGIAPKFTANPSILTPRYHGWLRDGVLVEC